MSCCGKWGEPFFDPFLSFFKLHFSSFYTRFDHHFVFLTLYLGVIPNEWAMNLFIYLPFMFVLWFFWLLNGKLHGTWFWSFFYWWPICEIASLTSVYQSLKTMTSLCIFSQDLSMYFLVKIPNSLLYIIWNLQEFDNWQVL
jgi:hypothetical protein